MAVRKKTIPKEGKIEEVYLTDKQVLFCREYIVDLNATQAAIRAGYSQNSANEIGCQNLAKLNIQNYIAELSEDRSKRTEITADRVLQELALIGFSDIAGFMEVNDEGAIKTKPFDGMDEGKTRIIKKIKETVMSFQEGSVISTKTEFELHDKLSALDKIGRHLGMWNDKIDHTTKGEKIENTVFYIPNDGRNNKSS